MGFNPMQKPITMYSDFTPMNPAFAPNWMQAGYNSLEQWQAAQNQTQLGAKAPATGPVIPARF